MSDSNQSRSNAGVRHIEILETQPLAFEGRTFGDVGAYRHIRGRLICDINPTDQLNATIVDLDKAPRNRHGRVEYRTDFSLLTPADAARNNGWLFYEVLNRGNKLGISRINNAIASNRFDKAADAGDGLLMRQGFTMLWSGWQGDVQAGQDRLVIDLPTARNPDGPIVALSREEFIAEKSGLATDEFIRETSDQAFIARLTYPVANSDPSLATLTVRQREQDERVSPPDLKWRYVDDIHIEIQRASGFDRGAIHEFVYPARDPKVMGLGLASIRDVVSYFREGRPDDASHPNPLTAGAMRRAMIFGASQSGRIIRDFIYEGLNESLRGGIVFDAALPVVTGSRRSFVNARFAQPGRYSRQHEDHWYDGDQFPFTYPTLTDPYSGRTDGILRRAIAADVCPKIAHIDADTELWAGRGSLLVTDCEGRDIEMPEPVRIYLAAGVPHATAPPAAATVAQLPHNPIPYSFALRALLLHLLRWVEHGEAPPPSAFPSRAAGTLVPVDQFRRMFPKIPNVTTPAGCNRLNVMDHSVQPPKPGAEYPVFVGSVDADGNTAGGIRHPLIEVPTATATGWNLRAKGYGEGDLYNILGALVPFAQTESERNSSGDSRASLDARYGSQQEWSKRVAAVAKAQVEAGFLLQEDAERLSEKLKNGSWNIRALV